MLNTTRYFFLRSAQGEMSLCPLSEFLELLDIHEAQSFQADSEAPQRLE
jgi:hypothetical protein